MKIEIIVGDITKQPDVEAIVNSANANLRLGSGVAGAIHKAAGPELELYCQPFAPLGMGDALITPGFKLANPWVIHVRSSHYINDDDARTHMADAMSSVLNVANANSIRSLAMPAIGIGVFKFPPDLAATITASALRDFEKKSNSVELVRICVVSEELRQLYAFAISG